MNLVINQKDFRKYVAQYDVRRKVWFSYCEELIDGRWEGFVSIQKTGRVK